MNRPERASEPHWPSSAELAAMRADIYRRTCGEDTAILHPSRWELYPTMEWERRYGIPDEWTRLMDRSEPHYPSSSEIAAMRDAMWRAIFGYPMCHPTHAPTWSNEHRQGCPDIFPDWTL